MAKTILYVASMITDIMLICVLIINMRNKKKS